LAIGVDALLGLARLWPYRAFRGLCLGTMVIFYRVAGRKLRRAARASLEIAWPGKLSLAEKDRIALAAYLSLVRGFVGHVYSARHPALTDEVFGIEGREAVDAALKQGKGAVFAIAHFGPFTWMLLKCVRCGWRVNVVMRPPRDIEVGRRLQAASAATGLNLVFSVPVRECVTRCRELLARGEVVVLPIDQNYGGPGRVFVDFCGRPAGTATGPAVFALKTGAPLFFAHALPLDGSASEKDPGPGARPAPECGPGFAADPGSEKDVPSAARPEPGRERFRVVISPEIPLDPGVSERDTLKATTARLTKMVESLARRYPEQWSWMHRRWKAVPRDGEI
jgi:KDO2-lipid IV(A) lauroyltransferase